MDNEPQPRVDTSGKDFDAEPATWLTVSRFTARVENGSIVSLYRFSDGPLKTYEELAGELEIEAAGLPPEQWIDGEFRVGEYIIEACLVGIYDRVDTDATLGTRYTRGGELFTVEQLREAHASQGADTDKATFDAWLARSLADSTYSEVEIMEYRDEEDVIVAERRVADR
jgi:hypothetical protein